MGSLFDPLTAGINALSSIGTNITNAKIANKNNAMQMQMARENNEFQERMNTENNEFAHNEAQLAFDRSVDQWMRENEYNAPVEQLARFENAGINPTLGLLGNSAMPSAALPSSPMAAPHGSGVSSSMPQFQQPVISPFDFAIAFKNVAEAKKAGAETTQLESLLDSLVKKSENEAEMSEFNNYLLQMFGTKQASANLKETIERTFKYTNEALLASKQGNVAEADKQAKLALKELYSTSSALNQKDIDHYDEKLTSQIQLNASTARLQNAQATTEDALRSVRKQLLGADYELTNNEVILKGIDARTEQALEKQGMRYSERINSIQKLAADRGLAQQEKDKAEQLYPIILKMYELDLKKGNPKDWMYYVDKVLGSLTSTAGAAAGAYIGSAPGKMSPTTVKGFR